MRGLFLFDRAIEIQTGSAWLLWISLSAVLVLGLAIYRLVVSFRNSPNFPSSKPDSRNSSTAVWNEAPNESPVLNQEQMKAFLGTDSFDAPVIARFRKRAPESYSTRQAKRFTGGSLRWHAAGETIYLKSGHRIDGMVYTASGLVQASMEPSAINERWQVASFPQRFVEPLGVWLSYQSLTPHHRRAYLDWLAAGRAANNLVRANIGLLLVFFCGLERRLVCDGDRDHRLFDELVRLLRVYGPGPNAGSFKNYCFNLLHFAGYRSGRYEEILPQILDLDQTKAFKSGAPYILAHLHKTGGTLRADFAFALSAMEDSCRKTPVTIKVNRELRALFKHRFAESWPDGIKLSVSTEATNAWYSPANKGLALGPDERMSQRLPVVIGLFGQRGPLSTLWNSCMYDLSSYSRAISKPLATTQMRINAWNALPAELRLPSTSPICEPFQKVIARAEMHDGFQIVQLGQLARLIGLQKCDILSTAQGRRISSSVRGLGWKIAPDPTTIGGAAAWTQEAALFQFPGDTSANLPVLSRLLYLTAIVCAEDLGREQLEIFRRLVSDQAPSDADWKYLRGTVVVLRRDPELAPCSLPRIAKAIPERLKKKVLAAMADVACSNGDLTAEQFRLLLRVGRSFEVPPLETREIVEKTHGVAGVVVLRKNSTPGEKIPAPRAAPFALDALRIDALSKETREIITLLSEIMADPIEAEPSNERVPFQPPEWLALLECRYHPPLLTLLSSIKICRADFNTLATRHHLLPEDLLCSINTWSDDTLGDFLLEGGDPIHVHLELIPKGIHAA